MTAVEIVVLSAECPSRTAYAALTLRATREAPVGYPHQVPKRQSGISHTHGPLQRPELKGRLEAVYAQPRCVQLWPCDPAMLQGGTRSVSRLYFKVGLKSPYPKVRVFRMHHELSEIVVILPFVYASAEERMRWSSNSPKSGATCCQRKRARARRRQWQARCRNESPS